MGDREGYLDQCKARAMALVKSGELDKAKISMVTDLQNFPGTPPLCDPDILLALTVDGLNLYKSKAEVIFWIDGFRA